MLARSAQININSVDWTISGNNNGRCGAFDALLALYGASGKWGEFSGGHTFIFPPQVGSMMKEPIPLIEINV